MYYLIGFGRYVYNTSNPIYFFNADNVVNETTTLHLNFASLKVGWQLGENFFIDSFIIYAYGKNPYIKTAIGLNFYFMPSFKFKK